MAKRKYKKIIILVKLIVIVMFFLGCRKNVVEEVEKTTKITLNKGAFVDESTDYKTFNLNSDNKYEQIDIGNEVINNFNIKSNTYTYYKDGSFYIKYNSKDIKINHDKIIDLKISPKGNYVFYFIQEEYLKPVVMDLKNEKEIILNNKVVISGQFIDWITDERLAYYGVNTDEKSTGIFTYDVHNNEEDILYKINKGYVKFLKHIDNGLVIAEQHYDGQSILNMIDINGTIREISTEVIDINDIESVGDKIYLLGRVKNNNFSIYQISNGEVKRLIFDFPNILYAQKGLSINEFGEVLFVGGTSNSNTENLYKYSDGNVMLVHENIKNCNFININ